MKIAHHERFFYSNYLRDDQASLGVMGIAYPDGHTSSGKALLAMTGFKFFI